MQPNNKTGKSLDKRSTLLIIAGTFAALAVFLAGVWLFTGRAGASTGAGGTAVIAPDYVDQVSEEVSGEVIHTLQTEILTDMITQTLDSELTADRLRGILSEDGAQEIVLTDSEGLEQTIRDTVRELGLTGDGVLGEQQQELIRQAVNQALTDALANMDVTAMLTPEQRQALLQTLRTELEEQLREQIDNSTYQISTQDLEKMRDYLNVEKLVENTVDKVTDRQISKIKETVLKSVEKLEKETTPVKGKDYLTPEAVSELVETALDKVEKRTDKEVTSVQDQVQETVSEVGQLKTQIAELSACVKSLDSEQGEDTLNLTAAISQINESIRKINTGTDELAKAIDVSGISVDKMSGSGSLVTGTTVSAAGLTIADFVDILAGNDRVYSDSLAKLNSTLEQLHQYDAEQDDRLSETIRTLESALSETGDDILESSMELEQKLTKRADGLEDELEQQEKRLDSESGERQEADAKLSSDVADINERIGEDASDGLFEGKTIFERLREVAGILSENGIAGLKEALASLGGASTVAEGAQQVGGEIRELKKNVWLSGVTLEPSAQGSVASGYGYVENAATYTYRIPVVDEDDGIALDADDTEIVVNFREPGRLPSNVAFSTQGNDLYITFTVQPTRAVEITSIHVYTKR